MTLFEPLSSQIVGSYAKPNWLANHQKMRALDGSWWRPDAEVLAEAKRDAVRLAVYEQERAGLRVVTDGEQQRAAYDRDFLACLEGIDRNRTTRVVGNRGDVESNVRNEAGAEEYSRLSEIRPHVTGEISWRAPVGLDELAFLRTLTARPVKANVVGPVSLFANLVDDGVYGGDEDALVLALAAALNQELLALERAGANYIQIDEPSFHFRMPLVRRVGRAAIGRMTQGVGVPVILHVCYGYALVFKEKSASPVYPELLEIAADCPGVAAISLEYEQPRHEPELLRHCGDKHVLLGLLDLANPMAETAEHIADRLRRAAEIVPPERLHPCSDCGMWYLPRELAYGKISALAAATEQVRGEI